MAGEECLIGRGGVLFWCGLCGVSLEVREIDLNRGVVISLFHVNEYLENIYETKYLTTHAAQHSINSPGVFSLDHI